MIVLHETNGRKYLEALTYLDRKGDIASLSFFEASVLWKFAHSMVRDRRPLRIALQQMLRNLWFRASAWQLTAKTVVICLPPWDWRLLYYARALRGNRIIYNTSWPSWALGSVPRPGGLFARLLRRWWQTALRRNDVRLTAVTPAARSGLGDFVGDRPIRIIPHVVSQLFFDRKARFDRPARVLFVGELVENRGLREIEKMLPLLQGTSIDFVGDGPLRPLAIEIAARSGGRWHGVVAKRETLGAMMASYQIFISPSIGNARWQELFGMAIAEAMACGLPCVVSDHVGPRSLIEDGVSGYLIPERSPERMAELIVRLSNDEVEWHRVSEAAARRAESNRIDSIAKIWLSIIAEDEPNEAAP